MSRHDNGHPAEPLSRARIFLSTALISVDNIKFKGDAKPAQYIVSVLPTYDVADLRSPKPI